MYSRGFGLGSTEWYNVLLCDKRRSVPRYTFYDQCLLGHTGYFESIETEAC